jgi:hypothetical protein
MTSTRSKVTRKTEGTYNVLYASGRNRREIVCSILPGDVLEFREIGRRFRVSVPIDSCFRFAIRCAAFAANVEKARKKNQFKPKKATRR